MKGIKEFFNCCRSNTISQESEITMQMKKRTQSCGSPKKPIFIKRSVGKKLDQVHSPKRIHIKSDKNKENIKIKRLIQSEKAGTSNSTNDFITQRYEYTKGSRDTLRQDYNQGVIQPQQFSVNTFNFGGFTQDLLPSSENEKIFELYDLQKIKIAIPKLLNDSRANRYKEIAQKRLYATKNSQLMTTMKTIIETNQQRSSIPSLEESHLRELSQIASKTMQKSKIYQPEYTPLTDKYTSMMMQQNISKQYLRMANSENLYKEGKGETYLGLIVSKLQMDNTIFRRQLNALAEQQNFLKQQRKFQINRFQQELQQAMKAKDEYLEKLQDLERIR